MGRIGQDRMNFKLRKVFLTSARHLELVFRERQLECGRLITT
jgi:hypothetical protein